MKIYLRLINLAEIIEMGNNLQIEISLAELCTFNKEISIVKSNE